MFGDIGNTFMVHGANKNHKYFLSIQTPFFQQAPPGESRPGAACRRAALTLRRHLLNSSSGWNDHHQALGFIPGFSLVQPGNAMRPEKHLPDAIVPRGPQGHALSPERLADVVLPAAETEPALRLHLAHLVPRIIFPGRQRLRKAPGTFPVTTGGYRHLQGFMGTLQVIAPPPAIKSRLTPGHVP